MGSIYDGQPVNALVTNTAKLDKVTADTAYGVLTLANSDTSSGPSVGNIQAAHNAAFQDNKLFICTADHSLVSFTSGQLYFTANILIVSKDYGVVNQISTATSPFNLTDGDSVYVTLTRQANSIVLPQITSVLPKGQDIFRLCTRVGSAVIFWDNTLVLDGKPSRIGGSTISTAAVQEIPTGLVDGSNANFVLSRIPPSVASLMMFKDGVLVPTSGYSIVNNVVTFIAGEIPQSSQTVSAYYLVESAGAPGPIPAGIEYIEYPIIDATEIAAKQYTLVATPAVPAKVTVDIIGDGAQVYGADFIVTGNVLSWSGLGLDGYIEENDQIRIHYFT
mgnify:CR=1 FL=1